MTSGTVSELSELTERLSPLGLHVRGAFHPDAEDAAPRPPGGVSIGTLALIGAEGGSFWSRFSRSAESGDGHSDPLDRWSRRVLTAVAEELEALAVFPFDQPSPPFLRWAQKAEPSLSPSPLGLLIHPRLGLWHSYRGALCFAERLSLPEPVMEASPCESCVERPCLSACPVAAFDGASYDVAGCAAHLATPAGDRCFAVSCQARRACPVGAEHRYGPEQARFHMGAFFRARSEAMGSDVSS